MNYPAAIETCFLPMIAAKKIKNRPIKRLITNIPIVIWRVGDEIKAAKDRCPHRNYPLSDGYINDGNLTCPYHGWEFANDGVCKNIPGIKECKKEKLSLEMLETQIIEGMVFVRLKAGENAIMPPFYNDGFDSFWWELEPAKARVYDALDNVLDPFHTNFIHHGFIRRKDKRQKVLQHIEYFENSLRATYIQDKDYGAMSQFLEGERTKSFGTYYPPICFQGCWEGPKGLNHVVTIFFVPETPNQMRSIVRFSMAKHKGPKWLKVALVKLFLYKVIEQDADALAKLATNIEDFGAPHFKISDADRLSAPFARLFNGQKLIAQKLGPFDIYL